MKNISHKHFPLNFMPYFQDAKCLGGPYGKHGNNVVPWIFFVFSYISSHYKGTAALKSWLIPTYREA
jgi:hypothetical protein